MKPGFLRFIIIAVLSILITSFIVVFSVRSTDEKKKEYRMLMEKDNEKPNEEEIPKEDRKVEEISLQEEDINDICSNRYSDECLYEKMIAKKEEYPEGMPWTNENKYCWKGTNGCGGGCSGFAYLLSDAAFDDLKALKLSPCPTTFRVGDVVRIYNDTHFVIILKIDKNTNTIIVAEGNYNQSIHWGREFTINSLQSTCNYIFRRNPNSE